MNFCTNLKICAFLLETRTYYTLIYSFTIYLHYFEIQHCNFHFWLETQVPKNPWALDLQHISYNKQNQSVFWKKQYNILEPAAFSVGILSKILEEFFSLLVFVWNHFRIVRKSSQRCKSRWQKNSWSIFKNFDRN